MTDTAAEEFRSRAMRKIEGIRTPDDFSLVSLWMTGRPEWRSLPDDVAEPLLQALEAARREVLRRSGALVP